MLINISRDQLEQKENLDSNSDAFCLSVRNTRCSSAFVRKGEEEERILAGVGFEPGSNVKLQLERPLRPKKKESKKFSCKKANEGELKQCLKRIESSVSVASKTRRKKNETQWNRPKRNFNFAEFEPLLR